MANFQGKSTVYLQSASVLKDKHQYYDASIQCSYYCCVQFMLYIVFEKLDISKEQFEADRRNNKDGTHGWASKLIGFEIIKKDKNEYKWFQKEFPELKALRENAAYSDVFSNIDKSEDAYKKADQIVNTLKKLFK